MRPRAKIDALAADEWLFVSGIVVDGGASIVLLSPDEPGFWPHFQASPEASDGAGDPLDRWSTRVIGQLAKSLAGEPLLPFGGPPWHPFLAWALGSHEAWTSPVGLLVHRCAGLFVSFRGAIRLRGTLETERGDAPCPSCAQPCRTACPVDAFRSGSYDVPSCKAHLETEEGRDCLEGGCLVRRACPIGAERRLPAQSAFHMRAFHPDAA